MASRISERDKKAVTARKDSYTPGAAVSNENDRAARTN
jgi:hypothetical protein